MRIVICRLKKIIKKTPFGVDIIVAILAGNGLGKYNLVISDFLFLTVGFIRPSGFKTLRQELSDALQFMRRSAPLNYEPCLSQALSFIP